MAGLRSVNRFVPGQQKVLVQDREADILRFFKAERSPEVDLIVRVFQPRNLNYLDEVAPLALTAEKLPTVGTMKTEIVKIIKWLPLL
jgi:hypothetical protein